MWPPRAQFSLRQGDERPVGVEILDRPAFIRGQVDVPVRRTLPQARMRRRLDPTVQRRSTMRLALVPILGACAFVLAGCGGTSTNRST
jgi:hypothetical protein